MASDKVPWADTPFALIPTPGRGENVKKLEDTVWIAREMACAHNGMLRGLNSIYQQCVFVKQPKDIQDLLLYTGFWCDWLHEHHEGEESILFPSIERITGVKGLMEVNIAQHHAFTEGLNELTKYAKETKVEEYDGIKLRGIIDSFGRKLTTHLTEEIQTLLSLKTYDGVALRRALLEFDSEMRKGSKSILFPIVMGTLDTSYEEGTEWPQAPKPIKVILQVLIHYWFERKYQSVWRFSPSTTWGERRPLLFTNNTK